MAAPPGEICPDRARSGSRNRTSFRVQRSPGGILPCRFLPVGPTRTMPDFKLVSDYQPTGDQPEAIDKLAAGVRADMKHQTLLGVTGSGKTFTMANVVSQLQR